MPLNQSLERGSDPAFPLLFHDNPASRPALFLSLSRISFFIFPKYIRQKRLIAVKANKCRIKFDISIDILNFTHVLRPSQKKIAINTSVWRSWREKEEEPPTPTPTKFFSAYYYLRRPHYLNACKKAIIQGLIQNFSQEGVQNKGIA